MPSIARYAVWISVAVLCCATQAYAAASCYTPEEVRAEKILRLHSELMVITVTCKQGSTGRDLVRAYTGFTRRYIKDIRAAERTLMDYFKQSSGGDGTSRLDHMRTKLANDFGQVVANESAPAYCAKRRDIVSSLFDRATPEMFENSIEAYDDVLTLDPPCGSKTSKKK